MDKIGGLLNLVNLKFKVKDSDFKVALARIIKDELDADIPTSHIRISGDVIFIQAHSVIKSVIADHQPQILALLKSQFPNRQVVKIV